VAVDPNGNAVAVWYQSDGTRTNIWANRFTPTASWGPAELIETDGAANASWAQVALDPNGNAVAVWTQSDGTRDNIWANRFTPTAGWGAAELVEADNAGDAWEPQVAVDPNGNAVAVWYQSDGTRFNVWANRFE
jgi:ribosomal protein L28